MHQCRCQADLEQLKRLCVAREAFGPEPTRVVPDSVCMHWSILSSHLTERYVSYKQKAPEEEYANLSPNSQARIRAEGQKVQNYLVEEAKRAEAVAKVKLLGQQPGSSTQHTGSRRRSGRTTKATTSRRMPARPKMLGCRPPNATDRSSPSACWRTLPTRRARQTTERTRRPGLSASAHVRSSHSAL